MEAWACEDSGAGVGSGLGAVVDIGVAGGAGWVLDGVPGALAPCVEEGSVWEGAREVGAGKVEKIEVVGNEVGEGVGSGPGG